MKTSKIFEAIVAPYVGAWIETDIKTTQVYLHASHPTWVRGLKLMSLKRIVKKRLSHPTWVRGLKQASVVSGASILCVAPYVGAWIETCYRDI